jgi:hypothetical protein
MCQIFGELHKKAPKISIKLNFSNILSQEMAVTTALQMPFLKENI